MTADAAYDTVAFYDAESDRAARVVVAAGANRGAVSTRPPVPCSRSNDRASAGPRPSAMAEGGGIPSAGARGERGLSVQIDHRTGSASPNGRRAEDRSAPRVQRAESDDRARSARILPHRSLRGRRYGKVPQRAILQQRLSERWPPRERALPVASGAAAHGLIGSASHRRRAGGRGDRPVRGSG